jgi:hypothetical protein
MLQVHGSIHHEGKNSTRGVEKAVSNSYGGDPGLGPPERWGPGLLQSIYQKHYTFAFNHKLLDQLFLKTGLVILMHQFTNRIVNFNIY